MKYILWLIKAAIFFTLFAFALNNQQEAAVNFFFGHQWLAPMVLIVLLAFAAGMVVGALGMLPHWWRGRRQSAAAAQATPAAAQAPGAVAPEAEAEPVFVQPDAPADEPASSGRRHG
ncbi:MAG: Lipopolysaccharide assembly protein A [Paracidovorax wautersii]|uniref:Lipopolysaccharide assembly protein A n=1 Tax=Paracidovorax wautersii TaxID=1177982 RepID=A0A7V8FLX8_9BURK|nr:MAG: Lipopolysaccharide assembly protein A [Paracidovorax wautersii]